MVHVHDCKLSVVLELILGNLHLFLQMHTISHKVGPTYGRRVLTGLLSATGFVTAQRRIGKSLQ